MPGTVQVLCDLGLILEKWVGRCKVGAEPGSREESGLGQGAGMPDAPWIIV